MIGPLPTASGGFNSVLVAIDKFTKWIEVKPVTCPKADRVLDFLDELVNRYGLPIASSQNWAPSSIITSSGSTARTAGSTFGMSQSPIHGPMAKSSVPMGWYSTPSRSDCTTLLTRKEESGSRNCQRSLGAAYSTHQAIIPADVMWESPAVEQYDEGISEDSRRADIDGLEEAHCTALV
jgi:hypothetical protein